MLEEARIHKFKAYGCNLLGPSTFDVLEEKCGYYLHKIECNLLAGISEMPKKPTFFFALLEKLKVNLVNDDRLLKSLARLKRLSKIVFLDTECEQEDLQLLRDCCALEHFEALNGSIQRICENPTFLKEWLGGIVKNSLRFLIVPFSKMSEQSLSIFSQFPHLVNLDANLNLEKRLMKDHSQIIGKRERGSDKPKLKQLHKSSQYFRSSLSVSSGMSKIQVKEQRLSLEGKVVVVMRANYELQTEVVKQLHSRKCKVYAFYEESQVTNEFRGLQEKICKEEIEGVVAIKYVPSEQRSLQSALKEAIETHKLERVDLLITGPLGLSVDHSENDKILQTFSSVILSKYLPNLLFADLFVFQAFEELIKVSKGSKVIVLSNRSSSISENFSSRHYTVRICGTALHQLAKNVSIEWSRKSEVQLVLVSLGQIETAHLKQQGLSSCLAPSASVGAQRLLNVLGNLKQEHNGKMVDFNLKIIGS